MTHPTAPSAAPADEFVLDNPRLRAFIAGVNSSRRELLDPPAIIEAIRPRFADLLADQTWLPARYQEPAAGSGMGEGIGTWLLYRAGDGGLAFSALVVPPGAQTPVHDHLAWGLVGLYRGEQDEEVFARRDDGAAEGKATLELAERRALRPGDFYELLPENDIHRVRTTSAVTSVSLHLLGNDNGCIWRHRFEPEAGRVEPFRSGYVNVDCQTAATATRGTDESVAGSR
jgi:predicted metal-dependent enzyme (double-stranded beta helix superfamily)